MTRFGFQDVDLVVDLGLNAKLSEAAGAMGLAQLERLDEVIALNHVHQQRYAPAGRPARADGDAQPRGRRAPTATTSCWRSTAGTGPLERDVLLRVLEAENVLAAPLLLPGLSPDGALRRSSSARRRAAPGDGLRWPSASCSCRRAPP
jgi:dTDP-4-amino-4,6-dideoxygalactose transaminase